MSGAVETRFMRPDELDEVLRMTVEAFDGFCIDQNLEKIFPDQLDTTWQERKTASTRKYLDEDSGECMVALVDGKLGGYITFQIDAESKLGYIGNLAVDKNFRGRKISWILFEAVFTHMREQGTKCCRVETMEQNTLCTEYYPRVGFKEIARQRYYCKEL